MNRKEAPTLHPRNLHQGRYDLEALSRSLPELKSFIFLNEFGNLSIDFANPEAVKSLNRALLKYFYRVDFWDIPAGFLCPPIPGRADYIHYLGDLLAQSNGGQQAKGSKIKVLDIGTGANLIYPIIGKAIYGWQFVGSESNPKALESAQYIISQNPDLATGIELRHQPDSGSIFSKILLADEYFDLTLCNPPFHESAQAAREGSKRKVQNLRGRPVSKVNLNFGGQAAELWTAGGELEFIRKMILESSKFKTQVFWFTTLVSKSEHLKPIHHHLEKAGVFSKKMIEMAQGNKKSRFVAWTFLNEKQQESWKNYHWR